MRKAGARSSFSPLSLNGVLTAAPAPTTRGGYGISGVLHAVADARGGVRPTAVGDGEGDRVRSSCREDEPNGYSF